ncbi:MAG: alpha/beta hydrolase [Dehalococcoidia bacterium]|nr:alpha/beta hydrolase [Dehalococcoidia bacterium]
MADPTNVRGAPQPEAYDGYVLVGGLRLHYRDWGDPQVRPVVLLHGGTNHARIWDSTARALAPNFRVIALDQRGHGESAWAAFYSTEEMAQDLDRFVSALRLDDFDLVGHSMGGMNALVYAAGRPSRLRRLVIVDIGPDMVPPGYTFIEREVRPHDVFATPKEAIETVRSHSPRADAAELVHRVRNNLLRLADGRWTWRHDPATANTRPPGTNEAIWARWRSIVAPTLLVRGDLSGLLSEESAQRMVREHSDCRLVEIAEAGHSVPLEQPKRLLSAIQSFLSE